MFCNALNFDMKVKWHMECLSGCNGATARRGPPAHRDMFAGFPPVHSSSMQHAIFDLNERSPRQRVYQSRRQPRSAALCNPTSTCTALQIKGADWYWFSVADNDAATVTARDFAEGGSLLVALDTGVPPGIVATVHWPWQNILAGEAQFALLMRIIFGNLAEPGLSVEEPELPWVCGEPQPEARPLPDSLALPVDQHPRFVVNVALGHTFFSVEALQDVQRGDFAGSGKPLACMHLTNSMVQYTMTERALQS